jgi:hypothetical protein
MPAVTAVGLALIVSVIVPEPARATICSRPPAVSDRSPVAGVTALGANPTLNVQLAFEASVVGQSFVCEKPLVMEMPAREIAAAPLFITVTVWVGASIPIG